MFKSILKFINKHLKYFGLGLTQIEKPKPEKKKKMKKQKSFKKELYVYQEWAERYGWHQYGEVGINNILLEKSDCRLWIFCQPRTAVTTLKHPTKGETQLRRENLTVNEVVQIIMNPREHIGKKHKYLKKSS